VLQRVSTRFVDTVEWVYKGSDVIPHKEQFRMTKRILRETSDSFAERMSVYLQGSSVNLLRVRIQCFDCSVDIVMYSLQKLPNPAESGSGVYVLTFPRFLPGLTGCAAKTVPAPSLRTLLM